MKLGLIGLPMSGKTTIFNALTGANRPTDVAVPGKLDVQIAVVNVPDPRLEPLAAMFNPRKVVPAQVAYADIGGLAKGISSGGLSGQFRTELSQMDGFLHVVRAFDNPSVPHPDGSVDAQRDLNTLDTEFLLADLMIVERRIEKLKEEMARGKDRAINAKELEQFEPLKAALESETPLRDLDIPLAEQRAMRGYGFLTLKPKLVLVNIGEEAQPAEKFIASKGQHIKTMAIQGALEAEIGQLDQEEAAIFMQEYGIAQSVRDRVIHESYNLLHIQTFFTVGEDEVRAWPHPIGATAQKAAGEIHSDLQRGFIRAEIVPATVLIELGGLTEARRVGKLRQEGKEYIMQDGDVMDVKFNV
ncbi:MAG: redox-regulated ATPase YchF [Anaerolineae bacterium]|nr:redox-regulated ATPase YchF [Anaerolineae bacterium]